MVDTIAEVFCEQFMVVKHCAWQSFSLTIKS